MTTTPALDLMGALRSGNSTAPRLTWYGPDAERVELSGRVLDNWVAKTSNLLQDELDAEPGMRLRLALPAHWKALVWALAGWQLGLETVLDGGPAHFIATDEPAAGTSGKHDAAVAVALPALAMRWPGGLPAGWIDYAAEVRSHGDVFMPHTEPDPAGCALRTSEGKTVPHRDLLSAFAVQHDEGARVHIPAAQGLESALSSALGAWQRGGSVVLTHPDVALTDKLRADERIHGH
ncbi:TIGR03089 family protein [Pseudarthrobacter sp. C4D7]|uniref:TIGR03089 family protein n=1 Tax=Pseudarthrobacter sp. C4D7 TaxID=2735268 RepID=UPI001584B348|nr:TIGR03089 family protein [Pseudarthrobacter sp. C4D7]NUT70738.1 TIGR03089 family protein [Pseudarthrobacter sp. C4D7]